MYTSAAHGSVQHIGHAEWLRWTLKREWVDGPAYSAPIFLNVSNIAPSQKFNSLIHLLSLGHVINPSSQHRLYELHDVYRCYNLHDRLYNIFKLQKKRRQKMRQSLHTCTWERFLDWRCWQKRKGSSLSSGVLQLCCYSQLTSKTLQKLGC